MAVFSGRTRGEGRRVGIVVSRFNDLVTERLLSGARACLTDHGVAEDAIDVAWAPGAWELPLAAQWLLERRHCDGVVALGCVIRGDTPHFDFVAGSAATGLANLSARTGRPVAFGVLTTDTTEQALSRAGGKSGNKGWEAAQAVLEMLDLEAAVEADRGP
jgi:6,7-dimethyl-8-ribityllumazine synthase